MKMDRLFRIDFYPQDWLIDTARLTPEERGIYIQIVSMIYANRGAIENDHNWIARASNCSTRLASSVIKNLIEKKFLHISGSKLTQKRAESELNMKRTHLELSSKGGRTKAEKEREVNKNKDLTSTDPTFSVSTPTATATPSPIEKDAAVASARERLSIFQMGEKIAEIVGWKDDPNWMGNYSRLEPWMAAGCDFDQDILPTIRAVMQKRKGLKPKSLKYFEDAIAEAYATRTTPMKTGEPNHAKSTSRYKPIGDALFAGFALADVADEV
jgi:uncharacterized protein YdaU (DUF1376 family)